EVAKSEALLGKSPECDVVLPGAKISRRHARLVERDDGFFVEDLKSTNGTYLAGAPVSGLQPVRGEVIRIGDFELRLEKGEAKPAPAAKADGQDAETDDVKK